MTKPLSVKMKTQRETLRKRESAKLAAVKKQQGKDRILRQKRLEIDERRRLLREHRWNQDNRRRELAEKQRKEKQQSLQSSFDERLQKKKRFGVEKVGKAGKPKRKGSPFYKRKMKVRGRGVTLSRLFGG